MSKPTAIVYIDVLNLQRRLIDQVPIVKWVDYWKLVEIVLPSFDVLAVKVFVSKYDSADAVFATKLGT